MPSIPSTPRVTARAIPSTAAEARSSVPGAKSQPERFWRRLEELLGSHRFSLWFGEGTELSIREGSLTIEAANPYARDWILRNFREQIETVASEILDAATAAPGLNHADGLDCDSDADLPNRSEIAIEVTAKAFEAGSNGRQRQHAHDETDGSDVEPLSGREGGAGPEVHGSSADGTAFDRSRAEYHPSYPTGLPSGFDDPRRRPSTARGQTRASRLASLRRLDDFVVGESNRLAFVASQQLGDGAAEAPSILFIHGECGVGKTHLLQGICRRRSDRAPRQVIKYVTAEQFTNEYIASVRAGNLEDFRRRLRKVDLLAIDDVHFFANKTATQTEFLHTIDAIDLSGARVAIVSDEHPRHIRRFSQSLVSRFLSGMVVRVDRPDRGTRVALVRRLTRERGLDLTAAGEDSLAGRCTGSIREIEGAVTRLGALLELDGIRGQVGPGLIERLLGDEQVQTGGSAPIRLNHIIDAVCDRLRVTREDLLGTGRHPRTVAARGLVAHLSREMTTHSYPEIARALGRDSHSAVHTAAKRTASSLESDGRIDGEGESLRETVDRLKHDIARTSRNPTR